MNIQPQSTQPISDDQELAKVLAGVNDSADASGALPTAATATMPVAAGDPPASEEGAAPAENAPEPLPEPSASIAPEPPVADFIAAPLPANGPSSELDDVKQDAINELRPLVDKLSLPAEEKFDTYLLLIRSTDDKTLIAPAHEAARAIPDETRRAQALLDIIKEIDFLSGAQPAA